MKQAKHFALYCHRIGFYSGIVNNDAMKIFYWLIALGLFFALIFTVWSGKQYLDCTEKAKRELDRLHIESLTASQPDKNYCKKEEILFDNWQSCLAQSELAQRPYLSSLLKWLNQYTDKSLQQRWQKHLQICPQ